MSIRYTLTKKDFQLPVRQASNDTIGVSSLFKTIQPYHIYNAVFRKLAMIIIQNGDFKFYWKLCKSSEVCFG